jgi:hypothetical protein
VDLVGQGERTVLRALRHHDELPRAHLPIAVTELHAEPPRHHEKELVLPLVLVPHELAGELDELDVHVIDLADYLRRPAVGEAGELLREIHHVHGVLLRPTQ